MLRFKILPVLLLVLVSINVECQTDASSSEIVHVAAILDAQQRAWNDGDIRGYMNGYWESDSLLFTSGGSEQRGWNATYEKYRKSYPTRALMGILTFSNLEIHLLSPVSAWVFGRWELKRDDDHPAGLFTLVLRKLEGEWKIVHDHTSMKK